MDLKHKGFPMPSDYFGVLWALSGIKDLLILEHGSTGTCNYNAFNYMIMNRQSPKGKLFSSGMDEDDVVMGRDEKVKEAIAELDGKYQPEVIALVATGVTSVIGLDLQGIIEEIQSATKSKLISFSSGGFSGDYNQGIKEVFRSLVNNIVEEPGDIKPYTVNIIGPTIDSFNNVSDLAELERMLMLLGAQVNTVFTCQTDVCDIKNMASASLNLVTRDIGLEAAEMLKERYGIPYYYGLPFGVKGSIEWMNDVAGMLGLSLNRKILAEEMEKYGFSILELVNFLQNIDHLRAMISCPFDYSLGLTKLMREEWGIEPSLVVLPEKDSMSLEEAIAGINPHILFGNSYDLLLAKNVPIKVHAAFPAFDHIYRYDGTPFVGLRGHAYLTQTIINLLNQNPEVFRN
ncbi:MAG: nitrogenase component 1 [Methanothrix sp.]|nr:nitrogenase component 1 [Methanothrix sp.]